MSESACIGESARYFAADQPTRCGIQIVYFQILQVFKYKVFEYLLQKWSTVDARKESGQVT